MKLKPCPFCGSEKTEVFDYPYPKPGLKGCFVSCLICGARSGKTGKPIDAIKAWNERKGTK